MTFAIDSSVLIDWLKGVQTPQVEWLDAFAYQECALLGDVVLAEVLQGARDDRHATQIQDLLASLRYLQISDHEIAIIAAHNYRRLRMLGITPRKTIDTLIATRCILDNLPLLFSDRDFQPFVDHLGLRDAMTL